MQNDGGIAEKTDGFENGGAISENDLQLKHVAEIWTSLTIKARAAILTLIRNQMTEDSRYAFAISTADSGNTPDGLR